MEIQEDIVIVGAGIAGLAAALALQRIGLKALVLERSDRLRTTGAALMLAQNAWVALDALGVANKLAAIYTPLEKVNITNVETGAVQQISFNGNDSSKITGPRAVHRATLLEALAEELSVDTIRLSSKLNTIETLKREGSSIAVLGLEDGTIIKAKVVVGCDGVHSAVARWLGLATPIHSGRNAVRGLSIFPQGHGFKHEVQQFVDRGTRAAFIPLNDNELYWFAAIRDADFTKGSPESIQKSVLEKLAHFPSEYLTVVQHTDLHSLSWAPLMLRVPWDLILYKNMSKDNITVAGDAMHPMTPDLGQGGCMALEDAVVLGRHIGNHFLQNGKIEPDAIEGYVRERKWRVAGMIAASYFSGRVQQADSSWFLKFLRDKVFYKYFIKFVSNIVYYDCGKLPSGSLSGETDESMKKLN